MHWFEVYAIVAFILACIFFKDKWMDNLGMRWVTWLSFPIVWTLGALYQLLMWVAGNKPPDK